ncbi:MAG: M23 family metallopeptidase [Burkholderiales bacterium]|nr:M23 family metallopeptidase [Burkholderiales bacterium]
MMGGAGGAFAVASASSQSQVDPSLLPVREVVEAVQSLPIAPQAEALDAFRFNLYRTEAVRASDTAEALLGRLGINDPAAAAFLRSDATFRARVLGQPGRLVTVEASDTQSLLKLSTRWLTDRTEQFQRFMTERDTQGRLSARTESAPLVASLRLASGVLKTSFYEAMDEAGVSESVAKQVLEIFQGQIDFSGGLKVGDRFNVVYEALEADGEPMRTGRVISAEFVNAGKLHQAMWFQEPGKDGGYFDLDGKSLERSFLASPMEVTRITSGFAMRFHPVLHKWKAHKGVDYGGAIGTPIRTIGDGRVRWAGPMGAYGNLVVVDHGDGDETFYAHLSRIDVAPEQVVKRGETIGALGATGRVSGPHLHFEFRENGEHTDPMLALRNGAANELSQHAKADFNRLSRSMRTQFAAANSVPLVASAE